MLIPFLLTLSLTQAGTPGTPAAAPAPDPPVAVAAGITLIRGAAVPGRGPDGNTIVLDAPDGLIVVDTGRHDYHSAAILALATTRQRPIVAIVNTHWHLDHSSGNGRLEAAFPKAQVYTTTAVDRALAPGGFLVRDLDRVRGLLAKADVSDVQKDEIRIFLATMERRDVLRPDVPVTVSTPMRIAGRPLDVRVTDKAVSDADLWLYDDATRVAIIGDLVTMPVPYFETACPDRWRAAMDQVWATPFTTAVPGHGRPMTRDAPVAAQASLRPGSTMPPCAMSCCSPWPWSCRRRPRRRSRARLVPGRGSA